MVILPIGRDDGAIQRDAWICYAVIAINVALFLLLLPGSGGGDDRELLRTWRSTVTYLDDRPYLLTPIIARDLMPERLRERTPAHDGAPSEWRIAKEQQTVNEMARELRDRYRDSDLSLAFVPAVPSASSVLTSMFMHAGLFHLVGNMFFLFATGPFLEKSLGRGWFALLYFGGGIVATLSFAARHPNSLVPLVGASGAIAAVMGAYLVEFGRSRLTMLFVPLIFIPTWNFRFTIPAAVVLPLWFLEQVVSIPMESGSMGGVAVTAHVAGFAAGLLFGGATKLADAIANARAANAKSSASVRVPPAAAAQGQPPQLAPAEALFQALERARHRGDLRAADDIACRIHARAEEKRDTRAEAFVAQIAADPALALPRFLIRTAAAAERVGDRQSAVERYERVAALETAGRDAVTALINAGSLYRLGGDEEAARAAFKRALMHAHCSDESRAMIYATLGATRAS